MSVSMSATASARRPGTSRRQPGSEGGAGRRHHRLQFPDRHLGLGRGSRPRLVRHERRRRLPGRHLHDQERLARHRARPPRLRRLEQLDALRHGGRRLRRHQGGKPGRHHRQQDQGRLDRGPRPRIRAAAATGASSSNISTPTSARSTAASPAARRPDNVSFKTNIVRAGVNYRF